MARPSTLEATTYLTTSDVMRLLGLARPQIKKRLKSGVFPPPTITNEHGVRFFDQVWLEKANLVLLCEQKKITPFELAARMKELEVEQLKLEEINERPR